MIEEKLCTAPLEAQVRSSIMKLYDVRTMWAAGCTAINALADVKLSTTQQSNVGGMVRIHHICPQSFRLQASCVGSMLKR